MRLDLESVLDQMLQGAKVPLGNLFVTVLPVATREFTTIASLVERIETDRLSDAISPEDARDQLAIAKLAARTALDTGTGLSTVAAEAAINDALSAVSGTFNRLLGFRLV